MIKTGTLAHYGRRGWHIFPLHTPCGEKGCSCGRQRDSPGKHPRTSNGHKAATINAAQIERWWRDWPEANVGLATEPSRLVVIDIDADRGGEDTWAKLKEQCGPELENTLQVITGGGGRHFYFKAPKQPITSRANVLGQGVDVRARGGYVVAPASIHRSGKTYEFVRPLLPVAPLPEALLSLLLRPAQGEQQPPAPAAGEILTKGARNDTLFDRAKALRDVGLDEVATLAALNTWNQNCCDPPLPDTEVRKTVHSAFSRRRRNRGMRPRGNMTARGDAPPAEAAIPPDTLTAPAPDGQNTPRLTDYHLTDKGNAQRLIARHGENLRYSHARGKWYIWNGRFWQLDEDEEIMRLAQETIAALIEEAKDEPSEKRRDALMTHALRSESRARLQAMVELARSQPGIPVKQDQLDADPWLLNCRNGTIELWAGSLRPHRRGDLITRMIPVDYDPLAPAPLWEAFLKRVMNGSLEMTAYLQRIAGYALSGSTREHCFFLLQGTGRNGKSVFLTLLQLAMAGYTEFTRPQTFLERDRSGNSNDIAQLAGARLVVTTEPPADKPLDESLVKQLTGGDKVTCRFLFREYFTYTPAFKIFMAANEAPKIKGVEHAVWARVRIIPFDVTIFEDEMDRDLPEKLAAELPGILAWMVEGCLAWRMEGGLKPPKPVTEATKRHRDQMDILAPFIEEHCICAPDQRVPARHIYARYVEWFGEDEGQPWSAQTFGRKLKQRGFTNRRGAQGIHIWHGIGLKEPSGDVGDGSDGCS